MKLYWGCLTSRRKGRAMQEPDKKEIVCYQRAINCSQSKRKWWSSSFIYLDIRLLNQRNVVLVVLKENGTFCFSYCPLDLKGFHLIAFIAHYCTLEKKKNSRRFPTSAYMVSKQEKNYRAAVQWCFVAFITQLAVPLKLTFEVLVTLLRLEIWLSNYN